MQQHNRILYKNHGGKIGYWKGHIEEPNKVIMIHATTLEGKEIRQEYHAIPKNIGRSNETTAMEQALLELESRTKKKMDKGYVTSLEAAQTPVTNSLGLALPMLATPLDKVKPDSIDWMHAFVQPKLDGHRCLYKDGQLYSRGGKSIEMPHVLEEIERLGMAHMHLDGELYIHGKSLQEISRLVKKQRPESVEIQYHVYDQVNGERFIDRITPVLGRNGYSNIVLGVDTVYAGSMEAVNKHHEKYRAAGYEGTMLRFGAHGYQDGKRSRELLKIKEFHDGEFMVVDVREGKPYIRQNITYQVPVWVCEADNGEQFTVTAAGTMEEKDAQWKNHQQYIDTLLTVKYHYLSKDGIPQLPIALRFFEEL